MSFADMSAADFVLLLIASFIIGMCVGRLHSLRGLRGLRKRH